METKSPLVKMFLAMITAAGVVACGADELDKGDPMPVVEMKTSMGTIKIELNRKDSPISVENFFKHVEKKQVVSESVRLFEKKAREKKEDAKK